MNATTYQGGLITHERTFQGAWRLTTLVEDVLYSTQYFDYTLDEALELFKEEVWELTAPSNASSPVSVEDLPEDSRVVGFGN